MRLISHPILCNYYLTYRCNASCSFCTIWERPSGYVKDEDFFQNLKDLKKLKVKVIDFTGGEPLLHRSLIPFLHIAKKMGFITTLTTNGLLYPKYAEQMKRLVDMLHFSLDSFDENQHNTARGIGCYNSVLQSIEIAKKLNEKPDILFTVSSQNIDQLEKVYQNISFPNGLILIINPIFHYKGMSQENSLSKDDLEYLLQFSNQKKVYLNKAFVTLRLDGGNHIETPVCKASSSTLVISPDNKLILPCYHLGLDEIAINSNLYDLYHSPLVNYHKENEGRFPECDGCTVNCYFQPSFAVEMNAYFFKALPGTISYMIQKRMYQPILDTMF